MTVEVVNLVGQTVGPGERYRILALVARGGFGAVFRAYDAAIGREVALKVLFPTLASDPSFVTRFRREAQAIGRLRHPHILEVYDFAEASDGLLYLVMPLVKGGTLRHRWRQDGERPWSPVQALA